MNIAKFSLLILAIYIFSILLSYFLKKANILSWLGIVYLSLLIFSIVFLIFIFFLAIIYAIIKKPEIEEGNYSIARIKGKEEMK